MTNSSTYDYIDESDDVNIFGNGSHVRGVHLFVAFTMVAAYLTICGQGLNYLENFTAGTPYHLMLQRIYRELMMVGFAAFAFTIFNETDKALPYNFYPAFGFADACCFVMAVFFCVQGILIMIGSIGQAHIWDVASKISTEELHLNVEAVSASCPCMWQSRFLPFCTTRDQVEFRILNSIFSSIYSISTKHDDFDFGMFLKMSHESNILSIIDISAAKWCVVLLLTAVAAIKIDLYRSYCSSEECYAHEEIYVFTLSGFVITSLSVFLWYWGRLSELRLIHIAGVECADDYQVFLMTEVKTKRALQRLTVENDIVKTAIAELLNEEQECKLEQAAKESLRRTDMVKRVASVTKSFRGTPDKRTQRLPDLGFDNIAEEESCDMSDEDRVGTPSIDASQSFTKRMFSTSMSIHNSNRVLPITSEDSEEGEVRVMHSPDEQRSALGSTADLSCRSETDRNEVEVPIASEDSTDDREFVSMERVSKSSHPFPVTPSSIRSPTRKSGALIKTRKRAGSRRRSLLQNLKRTVSGRRVLKTDSQMWRQSMEDFLRRQASSYSEEEKKQKMKTKMKNNYKTQNYPEVFLFGRPDLFYGLVGFGMTCNSLYLAWWATNFVLIAMRLNDLSTKSFLVVLSLLPALITFPLLALAIRSTSILKAITCLNVEVVAAVIERSEMNAKALMTLRSQLLHHFSREADDPKEGMLMVCKHFSEDGIVLTRNEFDRMLMHYRILYTPDELKFLFGAIDVNGGASIDMGEFEAFLYPDANEEANNIMRQKFFAAMNNKTLAKSGQKEAARRIIRFLDPKNVLDNAKTGRCRHSVGSVFGSRFSIS